MSKLASSESADNLDQTTVVSWCFLLLESLSTLDLLLSIKALKEANRMIKQSKKLPREL